MECIITIEIGTNAVRIFAFDLKGNIIGSMKGSYPTLYTEPDSSEQDPELIFITMLYALKNLLTENIHPHKYTVSEICFSASMHSVLAIDRKGDPIDNAIIWADNRGKSEANELRGTSLGEAIYRATGTPIHPMSPLVKITWLKNHNREKFRQTSKFLSIKSYIIQQLTGEYAIDYSLASATGLLNIHTIRWESEALAYAGITAEKLPDLAPIFQSIGKLRREYQTSLGLTAQTKIIVGSSDGCLATLGAGVWGEGKATVTIEDSGAVRVVGKEVIRDEKQRFFNYLLTENRYVSGGPTNNGGIIFEWFAKQFGDFKIPYDIDNSMMNLMLTATRVGAGAEGLLFLPYLLGERAPLWNANARGCYFGLNIKHELRHIIRATLEGILFEIYSIGKILEEHRTIDSLSVNGSFASIPLCSQMIADIFNKPVNIRKNSNSIGVGTFLLGATEMGIYANLDEAAQTVELSDTYHPDKQQHEIYGQSFKIFEKLSTKFSDEFEEIAALQQKH